VIGALLIVWLGGVLAIWLLWVVSFVPTLFASVVLRSKKARSIAP
jgi:hypothetical protein